MKLSNRYCQTHSVFLSFIANDNFRYIYWTNQSSILWQVAILCSILSHSFWLHSECVFSIDFFFACISVRIEGPLWLELKYTSNNSCKFLVQDTTKSFFTSKEPWNCKSWDLLLQMWYEIRFVSKGINENILLLLSKSLIWKTETHFVKGILHKVDSKVKKLYHSANLKLLICVHTHFKPPFFSFSNRKVMHTLLYGCSFLFTPIKRNYFRSSIPNTFLAVWYNKNKQTHNQNRERNVFLHLSPC